MSSSKPQKGLIHSEQIERCSSKSQPATTSMARMDQQTQNKTISGTVTLISTRTIIQTSSAKWNLFPSPSDFLGVPLGSTITSSYVRVVHPTQEISDSNSHSPVTSNHWAPTSQSKEHSYWTPIAFHTTVLSVNSTNQATIRNSTPTGGSQGCGCVSDVSVGTSILSGEDRCRNAKKGNATTWTINKSGKIMGSTIVATADTVHKWKNSTAPSTLMPNRIKTIASISSESSVANISRTPQLLVIKNQADSSRIKGAGFGTKRFLFLSMGCFTIFNI